MATGNNTGTVTWLYTISSDNASKFDFLSKDDTLTLTNTVKVDDGRTQTDEIPTQDIVITITGTNDTPILTGSQTGNITEDSGVDGDGECRVFGHTTALPASSADCQSMTSSTLVAP